MYAKILTINYMLWCAFENSYAGKSYLNCIKRNILPHLSGTFGDYSYPYTTLLSKVNSTSWCNKRVQNFFILSYNKLCFAHFPAYMKNKLSLPTSSYDLRGNYILSISKPKRTTYDLNCFNYFSARQWNALSDFFSC